MSTSPHAARLSDSVARKPDPPAPAAAARASKILTMRSLEIFMRLYAAVGSVCLAGVVALLYALTVSETARNARIHESRQIYATIACTEHGGAKQWYTQVLGWRAFEARAFCNDGTTHPIP